MVANQKRVVVTGIGLVTALGSDVETFFSNLLAGKSGIKRITRFDPEDYPSQVGAQVDDFHPEIWMDPKKALRSDRYAQFAIAASAQAVKHAGLNIQETDPFRVGVIIGSGIGGMETIETQSRRLFELGPRKVSPFTIPSLIVNMASGIVAIELGAKGPNFAIVSACATASHSIGESIRIIRSGDADVMIAGGSEAAITQLGYSGFCAMRAMSTSFNDRPEASSRPFDKQRDGFVMGEGAGVLVLESLEHALARGATPLCEIVAYAATCDAFHITSPDPEGAGLAYCLNSVLAKAGITPDAVGYINAHGTSTEYNDKFETLAIKSVFKEHAAVLKISSTKSMTGHLLGAAGGIEAAATIKALQTGKLPPTINQEEADPECDLDYIPNTFQEKPIEYAISNNLGFGGQNACLLMKKYK